MNRGDAVEILDELCASYHWVDLDSRAAETWVEALVETGADPAATSRMARTWARTNEHFPSLAQFLAAVRPHQEWRPDPDTPEIHPAVTRRIAGMWGQAFDAVDKRIAGAQRGIDGHWHGTPGQPCPVCGGSRP